MNHLFIPYERKITHVPHTHSRIIAQHERYVRYLDSYDIHHVLVDQSEGVETGLQRNKKISECRR